MRRQDDGEKERNGKQPNEFSFEHLDSVRDPAHFDSISFAGVMDHT